MVLEVLFPEKKYLHQEIARAPLVIKLWILLGHFRLFIPVEELPRKGVTKLAEAIHPDEHKEVELLLHSGRQEVC